MPYNDTLLKGKLMFKNRHFEVKFVKTPQTSNDATPAREIDPEQIASLAKDFTKYAAISVGAVAASGVVLQTLSKIAVIAAEAALKK